MISLGGGNRIDFMVGSGWGSRRSIRWGEVMEAELREKMRGKPARIEGYLRNDKEIQSSESFLKCMKVILNK